MKIRPRFLHRVAGLACIAKRLEDGPASQSLGRRVGNSFGNSSPSLRILRLLRWSRLQFHKLYQYRQFALFASRSCIYSTNIPDLVTSTRLKVRKIKKACGS
jgi:hypothetical protein